MDLQFNFFVLYFASQAKYAPLAQLDRAFVYGTKGQGFESLATHQKQKNSSLELFFLFIFVFVKHSALFSAIILIFTNNQPFVAEK